MKKVYLQRLLKFAALLLPLATVVLLLQNAVFMFGNTNTDRLQKFYLEEENSLDVVIVGASEVHYAYLPGYAYDQYGYTSYLYSLDGNLGATFLPQIKEIEAHQNPGLILIEVGGYVRPQDQQDPETNLRLLTQSMPVSSNKWATIMDTSYDNKISCFFPFLKYHGDLELAKVNLARRFQYASFLEARSFLKGAVLYSFTYLGLGETDVADSTNCHITPESEADLLELLTYCRQEQLDHVVFANFPRLYQNESTSDLAARINEVRQIVEANGFEFWDLQKDMEQIGLDTTKDFASSDHLNSFGQEKFTQYLGSLVINRHQLIPTVQSPKNRQHWLKCSSAAKICLSYTQEKTRLGELVTLGYDTDLISYLVPEHFDSVQALLDVVQ